MQRLIAERALLPDGWRRNVLLEWNDSGCLTRVDPYHAEVVDTPGIVLPGMPNLHSHAFQRAMAGLTETRSDPTDSFWSWRTLMYQFAQKLTPSTLKAIALQLYIEMLKAGFTSVCEFHYLHHAANGQPYANPAEHAECLIAAAAEAGIGLTLLPVLYQYSGFGAQPPHAAQARFISSPRWILDLLQRLQHTHPQHAGLRYGVAPHSLRAVSPASLRDLVDGITHWDAQAPIHIHIAEQTQEVDDCVAALGAPPVAWLLDTVGVDARWCLVHATHMTEAETAALAKSAAVAGICPSTEANLGDGFFNGAAYLAQGGAWGIGSDSHVSISLREELRLFEYSQRLLHRQRNVLLGNGVSVGDASVGDSMYRSAVQGGAAASGRPIAGLTVGQQADLLVLDATHADLVEKNDAQVLDGLVFCNHGPSPVQHVMAGGRWVVRHGQHHLDEHSMLGYRNALRFLLRE